MKKILIIEDNPELRENLSEILELSGYETTVAENGKLGIEKALNQNPDLILCDVMMPELDGFGVLKILNNNPTTYNIPFMFLTAKADKTDFRKGMGLGADDYITKPFDDVELLQSIEMRLAKSERINKSFDHSDNGLQRFFNEARAEKELERLSENREIRKYRKRDLIYEEGQYPKWLFFVVSGKVKSSQINDFGKELITNIYEAGDFFGYTALLRSEPYSKNTVAMEDTTIRLIPSEDFSLLLFNNRDFAAKFIKMLSSRMGEIENQLIEIAYSSVRKKVANALLTLHMKNNKKDLFVLRDDLASLAGTAKETVIRTLSDFKKESIIDINQNSIKLLDIDRLQNMPQ